MTSANGSLRGVVNSTAYEPSQVVPLDQARAAFATSLARWMSRSPARGAQAPSSAPAPARSTRQEGRIEPASLLAANRTRLASRSRGSRRLYQVLPWLAELAMVVRQMRDLRQATMGIGAAQLGGGGGWRVHVGQLGPGAAQR
jgi:hypothetical protein